MWLVVSLVGWRVRNQVKPIQSPVSAKAYASACLLLFTVQSVWLAAFTVSLLRLLQTPTPPKKGAKSPSGSGTDDPASCLCRRVLLARVAAADRQATSRQCMYCRSRKLGKRCRVIGWASFARGPKWDEAECKVEWTGSARESCAEDSPAKRSRPQMLLLLLLLIIASFLKSETRSDACVAFS